MEKLAIIGSGTMGHSIALSAAWSGLSVKMYGLDDLDLSNGLLGIQQKISILIENGLLPSSQSDQVLSRISLTKSKEEAVSEATFVIECIPEDLGLKQELFKYLDEICSPDVILASNTSGLSLSKMLADTKHPERFVLTHFWNPAHLIPLVEVLRTSLTASSVFKRTIDLLNLMGKKPVEVKKEVPGLIGNRLQFALLREALSLLEEGVASKEDIDAAVIYSIGRRLPVTGPIASADMGGLDVFAAISDYLFKDLSNADRAFSSMRSLVEQKKMGLKSFEGFYLWDKKFSDEMTGSREKELIRQLKQDRGIE
jgi:3-hydroxybutyryl-CoA dehydrogenase